MMRAVLTYHSVDETGSPISISPAAFRRHVAWLAGGAITVLPLGALLADADGANGKGAIALTFDDAIANFATHAAPLLREHGLPATLFVVPGRVGRDNRWGGVTQTGIPDLPLLDWDAIGALADGGFEVGVHTRTHPHLTRLSASAVEDELLGATEDIAVRLGRRPETFSYPYGDCNDAVAAVARRTFSWSCTTDFRVLRAQEDAAHIPRLDACSFRGPGRLEGWGTPAFRLELQVRAGARQVRRLLRAD